VIPRSSSYLGFVSTDETRALNSARQAESTVTDQHRSRM
jgi:hypothetical protein